MWQNTGQRRPDFADEPGPGQESVWDYPRPPAIERLEAEIVVRANNRELARASEALRVLETASPPTVYLPPADVVVERLSPVSGRSYCEWKGRATYFALADDPDGTPVAWCYPEPNPRFSELRGHYCFYPARVACFIDGERVRPQEGGFYGGWVTDAIVGPWKGQPGTGGW